MKQYIILRNQNVILKNYFIITYYSLLSKQTEICFKSKFKILYVIKKTH